MYNLTPHNVPHGRKNRQDHAVEETKEVFHSACCSQTGQFSPQQASLPTGGKCCAAQCYCPVSACLFSACPSHLLCHLPAHSFEYGAFSSVAWPLRHPAHLFPFTYKFQIHFPDVCLRVFCIHLLGGLKKETL